MPISQGFRSQSNNAMTEAASTQYANSDGIQQQEFRSQSFIEMTNAALTQHADSNVLVQNNVFGRMSCQQSMPERLNKPKTSGSSCIPCEKSPNRSSWKRADTKRPNKYINYAVTEKQKDDFARLAKATDRSNWNAGQQNLCNAMIAFCEQKGPYVGVLARRNKGTFIHIANFNRVVSVTLNSYIKQIACYGPEATLEYLRKASTRDLKKAVKDTKERKKAKVSPSFWTHPLTQKEKVDTVNLFSRADTSQWCEGSQKTFNAILAYCQVSDTTEQTHAEPNPKTGKTETLITITAKRHEIASLHLARQLNLISEAGARFALAELASSQPDFFDKPKATDHEQSSVQPVAFPPPGLSTNASNTPHALQTFVRGTQPFDPPAHAPGSMQPYGYAQVPLNPWAYFANDKFFSKVVTLFGPEREEEYGYIGPTYSNSTYLMYPPYLPYLPYPAYPAEGTDAAANNDANANSSNPFCFTYESASTNRMWPNGMFGTDPSSLNMWPQHGTQSSNYGPAAAANSGWY